MTDGPDGGGIYKPIPSFSEWNLGEYDAAAFERYAGLLAESKSSATPENLARAMTSAMRYAAIDTGAIEGLYTVDRGFTRTVATQAVAWEAVIAARGSHVRPAFEDALNGYEYVLDAATRAVAISELWLKELHQIICASQDTYTVYTELGPQKHPLPKGTYKTMPNSPTLADGRVHAYAPVADTIPEMQRLVDELRTDAFIAAHPVVQAAYAHYAYVCIHPFADGNGRVARALASVYLYRSPGVPFIVFADQRNDYLDALESADNGDPFPFVEFVMSKTIDAIGIIRSTLQRSGPTLESSLAGLNKLFASGLQDDELRATGARLAELAAAEMASRINALSLPTDLRITSSRGNVAAPGIPHDYGTVGDSGHWFLRAKSSYPVSIDVFHGYGVYAKTSTDAYSDLVVVSPSGDALEVWVRELIPTESEALKLKLAGWIEGRLEQFLAIVAQKARRR